MIVRFLRYWKGYVKIRLNGFSPERFLNLCSNHNILIWELVHAGDCYEMCITVKGFRKLKPILKKTKTRITILERHGLPFFLHKYRRRKTYFVSIAVCIALIFAMSRFVWNINIEGNYTQTTEVIIEYLETRGISHGIAKGKVDCFEIVASLREEFDDIIWASAKIQGTRLMIRVQENTDTVVVEENADEYEASDLIANKAGVVTEIITRKGVPQVEAGDQVEEGDVLVLGRIDLTNDSEEIYAHEYCAADADIYIETTYAYEDSFPKTYVEKEYTGEVKKAYSFQLFSFHFSLFSKKPDYPKYDLVANEKQLKITENFYLPVSCIVKEYSAYKEKEVTYTKEEAVAKAEENLKLFNEKLKEKGVQIFENSVRIDTDEEKYRISGDIVVVEKIGKRVSTEKLEEPRETETEEGNLAE